MAYDFRCSSDMTRHPKFLELKIRCGEGVLWAVMALYSFATERRPDGNLSGMSDLAIELASDWRGEPGLFISTMLEVRLMDGNEKERQIHDWIEHQSYCVKRQELSELNREKGKKSAQIRAEKANRSSTGGSTGGSTVGLTNGSTVGSTPIPSHPKPIPSQPNLEIGEEPEDIHSRKPAGLPTTKSNFKAGVHAIFALWCQVMEHPNAKLGPKRQRRIEWALKNYGLERAQRAIIGCAASAFHMGDNKDGKRFDDIELIFRNEEKFEAFEIQGQKATVEVSSETGDTKVAIARAVNDTRTMTIEQEAAVFAARLEKKGKPSGVVIENQYAPCQFPQITEGS